MTIGEQLKQIFESLSGWAQDVKGSVTIAEEATHLISMLITAPGAPRAIVMFDTEEKAGEYEELGRVNRQFIVVITRGRSMRLEDGKAILEGSAGGRPFYDLLEEAREVIRGLRFERETTDGIPDYKGVQRIQIDGYITDARQITFTIGTQLPAHTEEEEE